ncbi:Arc family DNA binding domain-containing protein [Sphingobacterium endophyticum]|uniref:Arc family DNA binding domain-containing protein n=1 Tax=Sphingobacterium endophyticum TaxID=2546448 RepID=UPI001E435B48|nr:Arc family DNA binding domain-containing protein [Sphingobacterium endophyticum]
MKKSFVIRIDEETFKLLENWAQDEFRSVNGQIEFLIHQGLQKSGRMKKNKSTQINKSVDKND